MNGGWGISYEIVLKWMPLDLTDDKSTLVQVMAWCGQAPSHYLSQCWPRFMSPSGVTRPHIVNWILTNIFCAIWIKTQKCSWEQRHLKSHLLSDGHCVQIRCANTLRTRQNGRHFPDDIFKCIFLNENVWITIKISLKFVPKGPISNYSSIGSDNG